MGDLFFVNRMDTNGYYVMVEWTEQQITTIALNGGWVVEYADYLECYHVVIYVSKRFYDFHMREGLINNITIACLYPWEVLSP